MSTPTQHDGAVLSSTEGWAEGKSLVLAYQAGDTSAYDAIYERYEARVKGICRRMLLDPQDVQEASQEAFLRVYQALGRFNGRYELGAWIARITTNVCLDNLRSRGRRPKEMAQLEAIDLEGALEGEPETPETAVIRKAEGRRVRKVLASLPPLHRAAIVLRDFEGLSYAEIAGALKISEPQVKALLHRARGRFKRDWSSLASIFIPVRLIQRLKGMPPAAAEGAALSSTSAPQLVTSCSTILQHCGQFIAEKAVPGALALGVGLFAGTSVARTEPAPVEMAKPVVTEKKDPNVGERFNRPAMKKKADRKKSAAEAPVVPVAQPSPTTAPTPEPTPTGAPPAEQGEQPSGGQNGGGSGPTPTTPPPFSPAMGFGTARPAPVSWNHIEVDCDAMTLHQDLEAGFWHGDQMYTADLDLDADGHKTNFELLVYPDGADVEYTGTGSIQSITQSETTLRMEYSGTYTNTDAPDAKWKDLPVSGTFHISVELDCTASSVITETVQLSAG
ncbi:MAG TPA: RNA polymerase sigma factor [Actinomycetota bacterium]|nr:RNA polymerase sigma factor [Actinomycetota bacterium]